MNRWIAGTSRRFRFAAGLAWVVALTWGCGLGLPPSCRAQSTERVAPSPVGRVVEMADRSIDESSGLAFSAIDPTCVWTHNDSGDSARLFAIETATGKVVGGCQLEAVEAIDFEAMTLVPGKRPRLVMADCGDNLARRDFLTLYLFDEPDPRSRSTIPENRWRSIRFRFEDGPANCEAIGYDRGENQLVLVTKNPLPWAGVYVLPMPTDFDEPTEVNHRGEDKQSFFDRIHVARRFTSLTLPMVTGMDFDFRTGDLWLVTYWNAIKFPGGSSVNLSEQLKSEPVIMPLPRWKQVEAVAVDPHGGVWISSEGSPGLLGRLSGK